MEIYARAGRGRSSFVSCYLERRDTTESDTITNSIFTQEYVDLTNRLTKLETREKELLQRKTAPFSTSSTEASTSCSSSGATSPTTSSRNSISLNEYPMSPPLRAHVRAFLPNQQRTMVRICIVHVHIISVTSCMQSYCFVIYNITEFATGYVANGL